MRVDVRGRGGGVKTGLGGDPVAPFRSGAREGAMLLPTCRHCERSEPIQILSVAAVWIASLRSQ